MEQSKHFDSIRFKKATPAERDAVLGWLEEPHIKEFWDNSPEHREDIIIFMNGRKKPTPYWDGMFDYWVGMINEEPYCLIMTSEVLRVKTSDVFAKNLPKDGRAFSLDFMIGDPNYVGKGLGATTLEAFTEYFSQQIPNIHAFMIDPADDNPRAKHVYEKAGFVTVEEFHRDVRQEKNVKHFLMVRNVR